ncbi:MAG: hypothetical protein A3J63_02815 [Candidatus Moranbacteria bacterium RIFCSPHIGHO2_02_FULL_40_12b]|nr:MAG: hypothetical protein A3J63_02815 [Candidatus Moranbacteria bacterium RIFCSPHIGHO2_02_FULL_40_12b]
MAELYENSYNNKNHFSFGKNWQSFLKTLDDKRINEAKKSLVNFLGGEEKIKGKTFVDIGCGSGLFSLSAYLIGASKVVSVDVDDFSVTCVKHLKEKQNNPPRWEIIKGSALDENFIKSLGQFDIVYSWGVLHHTGDMHKAFENITLLTHELSQLYLAIYNDNKLFFEGSSSFWLKVKRLYNKSSRITKRIMEGIYIAYFVCGLASHFINPITYIRNYQSLRGMNFFTDIKDWLGGYPYEYASTETIVNHFKNLDFMCAKTIPARSIGCNEFLFIKITRN